MHPSPVLLATAAAVAIATPARAQTPAPTIGVDRQCYSAADEGIHWKGAGFTPGGPVDLFLTAGARWGGSAWNASGDGTFDVMTVVPDPDDFLEPGDPAETILAAVSDRTRVEAGDDTQYAATIFRLSRLGVAFGRLRAGRAATFSAYGFTTVGGETLYAHYRRGGRTVRHVRIGRLEGVCGDVHRRVRRAAPGRPGSYKVVFNTSPDDVTAEPRVTTDARVRR